MKLSTTPTSSSLILIKKKKMCFFFHLPSRRITLKAYTYNKQHEYVSSLPPKNMLQPIFTHQKIEKLLLFPTPTLSSINTEDLYLQKHQNEYIVLIPSLKYSSTPNTVFTHPYQEIENLLHFPHPPARRVTSKAYSYKNKNDYIILIPS